MVKHNLYTDGKLGDMFYNYKKIMGTFTHLVYIHTYHDRGCRQAIHAV